jgi:hypothetical protein
MIAPTRSHPGVLAFEGRIVCYWRDGAAWRALEQGRKGEIPMTERLLEAIEHDQKHGQEKD